MSAEELAAKYIAAMEKTLKGTTRTAAPLTVSGECVDEMFGYVKSYLADAKYFLAQKKFETSLVSIAYCEGFLDALKIMGAVKIRTNEK